MYSTTPNLDEERGLTLPRVNMLIEQGERRRTRESMMAAAEIRVARSDRRLDEVFRLAPERHHGDGTAPEPAADDTPWWSDDDPDASEE